MDPVDQVANAEMYRCGVDEAGGFAEKKVAKLAASEMFVASSNRLFAFWMITVGNRHASEVVIFSPSRPIRVQIGASWYTDHWIQVSS